MLEYFQEKEKSIGDGQTQMEFLVYQLSTGYKAVWNALVNAKSVREASDAVLLKFERPADQSEAAQIKRAGFGQTYYDKYAKEEVKVEVPKVEGGNGKMKYSDSNKPLVCMQTQSTCYKGTSEMTVKGVLWHSTGANNSSLKRYIQPSDVRPAEDTYSKSEWLKILGKNQYNNDWNHIDRQAGLNCWIGKLADGTVTTVQTMPWNWKPWGCGSGSKGSCNSGWIQFEICEDGLTDKAYFEKVYKEACEITAYLCKMFNIDPKGTVTHNGVKVPTILCHQDSYKLGLGSNHGDVLHWFPKFGKSMADARNDVATLMGAAEAPVAPSKPTEPSKPSVIEPVEEETIKKGDKVKLVSDAKYTSGKSIPDWVFDKVLYAREPRSNGTCVFSTVAAGPITGVVYTKDLIPYNASAPTFKSYIVRITADVLNVRAGAGTGYQIKTQVKKNELYTIVDEKDGWGKLKSGAGWIHLGYTKKV